MSELRENAGNSDGNKKQQRKNFYGALSVGLFILCGLSLLFFLGCIYAWINSGDLNPEGKSFILKLTAGAAVAMFVTGVLSFFTLTWSEKDGDCGFWIFRL